MADSRFFRAVGPFSLAQLAEVAEAELVDSADAERIVRDVAPLDAAGPDDISFLDNKRYLAQFATTGAGACLVHPDNRDRAPPGTALLLTRSPYKAYALVARAFYPPQRPSAGRHASAVVDPSADIGDGTAIGPGAVIGARVRIGRNCVIKANAVIEDGVEIGDGTEVGANAVLSHCLIGRDCLLHAGVAIGNRGFGFAIEPDEFVDVPQLGRVIVEDGVEVGANSTIDRGAGPDTVVGAGSKIDNLVQIGHNVRLGRRCVLVAQSGIAGSTRCEDHVMLAAQAGVAGHLTLGKGAQVSAKAGVMRDIPAGQTVAGIPSMPIKDFFRIWSLWQRQLKERGKGDG